MTVPNAVFTLLRASADVELNSKIIPLILYDWNISAMLDNQGKVTEDPGLMGYVRDVNVCEPVMSPRNSR